MNGIKSSYDYLKEERKTITTTINKKVYKQWKQLSTEIEIPTSKMYDVLIMELFQNEENVKNFIEKVKQY
jgi:hypothetical protein